MFRRYGDFSLSVAGFNPANMKCQQNLFSHKTPTAHCLLIYAELY
jgi:hypothetical protein